MAENDGDVEDPPPLPAMLAEDEVNVEDPPILPKLLAEVETDATVAALACRPLAVEFELPAWPAIVVDVINDVARSLESGGESVLELLP